MVMAQALVVDGNVRDRLFLINHLRSVGYSTIGVGSGHAARKLLKERFFDLLILDSVLPDTDSFRLCHEIRNSVGPRIVIIFVSRQHSSFLCVKALDLGADDFVEKADNADELLARIEVRLFRQSFFDDPAPRLKCQGGILPPLPRASGAKGRKATGRGARRHRYTSHLWPCEDVNLGQPELKL